MSNSCLSILSVVRADAKTWKKIANFPSVKMTIFFCENLICGPRWTGRLGMAHLRVTPFSCFFQICSIAGISFRV